VDLGQTLGLSNDLLQNSSRTLIVRSEVGMLALPISEARAVVWVQEESMVPVHATSLPYMSGEVDDGESASPILSIAALVTALAPGEQP
jgi:chemotaxis signal transduction protein